MSTTKHIHIIAVGGTAMASLAGLLIQKGYRVTGSDQNIYPPMSTQLEQMGIRFYEGYKPENLGERPDLVVIGNTIKANNEEAVAAIAQGLAYESMPSLLNKLFLQDKASIVVAGTHGKTTTTSLMAWVLSACGKDPSFLIGGIPQNFTQSYHVGAGEHFVIEGDEYGTSFFDKGPKFLHYNPKHVIMTGIEYDHADIYDSVETIEAQFAKLVALVPADGIISVCAENERAMRVARAAVCGIETYGLSGDAKWSAHSIDYNGSAMSFTVTCNGSDVARCSSQIVGKHNLANILGVFSLAMRLGIDRKSLCDAIASFKGVKRRMEVVGEVAGITVIDDFAHHPTAIRETVAAARLKYPNRRLWTIFEPRTNSTRRNIFQQELAESLADGGVVAIAPVFNAHLIAEGERFAPEKATDWLRAKGVAATAYGQFDDLYHAILKDAKRGDVLLVLSNGGFNGIHGKLTAAFAAKEAAGQL